MKKNPILAAWQAVLLKRGGEPAIFGQDGSVKRTFQAIEAEAEEFLSRLPDTGTVGLQVGNSPCWPGLLLAAWRKGLTVLPMDGDLTAEIRNQAEQLCGLSLKVEWEENTLRVVPISSKPIDWCGQQPDLIKLTSGTTGSPRGVRFSAAQLLADCSNVCDTMGIGEGDINYGVISFAHSYGFSNLITPLLCRGVSLVAANDVLAMARGLRETRATILPAVPAMYRVLNSESGLPETLRLCISAGAPLPLATAVEFRTKFHRKIHSFYGASECGGICYDESSDDVPQGFVGKALKGVTLKQRDSGDVDHFPVYVVSEAVGMGYHPEGEKEFDGIYSPPDLLTPEAEGFRITGRSADFLNIAGRKISPGIIEAVISQIPGVCEVVIFSVESDQRGESIHACVAGEGFNENTIRSECSRRLPAWQVPRYVHLMDEIPVTSRGKISRRELAERFGGQKN